MLLARLGPILHGLIPWGEDLWAKRKMDIESRLLKAGI